MKKIYNQEKYINHSLNRAKDELKKRRRFRKYNNSHDASLFANPQGRRIRLTVPKHFSILDNPKDTLIFFDEFQKYIQYKKRIFIDMEDTTTLGIDALLYIISLLSTYKDKRIIYDVLGNLPEDQQCKDLIIDSGFFNYVKTSHPRRKPNDDILQIKSGQNVDQIIAKEVIDFSLKHLDQNISSKSKSIYRIIIEMMGNTFEHAYEKQDTTTRWHLIAMHSKDNDEIKFIFLDSGSGIPTTIHKNFADKAKEILSNLFGMISADSQLIMSALDGDFKTRTQLKWRGNGLPSIKDCWKKKHIENLQIFSNYGYIDCNKGYNEDLKQKFNGTLYSWNFV